MFGRHRRSSMRSVPAQLRGILLGVALATAALFLFYGPILRAPDAHMFSTTGDGLKNYFSFAWHARYDTSAFTFAGMNAPFGEHIDMPDAQPLISNAWRTAVQHWPSLAAHSVGLENLLMLGSLVLAALFITLLLMAYEVPWWYAAIGGVGIAFTSAQIARMPMGHYALAYGWCLPLTWWLMLRQEKATRPGRAAVWLGLSLLGWFLVHVYLGLLAAAFVLLWALARIALRQVHWRRALAPIGAAMIAMLAFGLLQGATDTHVHRTAHPDGFFDYRASPESILLPDPRWEPALYDAVLGERSRSMWEGSAFIGGGALLCLVLVLGLCLAQRWWKRDAGRRSLYPSLFPPSLAPVLWASFALLLFAFGLPYALGPLKKLLWHSPVVRQFRAPGRAAWVFQLVIAVWAVRAAWVMGRHLWDIRRRWLAVPILAIVPGILALEAEAFNRYVANDIARSPNVFDRTQLSPDLQALIDLAGSTHARALLTLPYFHNGGEELMLPADEPGLFLGQVVAYHTGIPLMTSSLTRTSLDEVRWLLRATGPAYIERDTARLFSPDDTLLVIASGSPGTAYDADILLRAHRIGTHPGGPVATLTVGELLADRRAEMFDRSHALLDTLVQENGHLLTRPGGLLLQNGFEAKAATHVHAGRGAFAGIRHDHLILAELPPGTFERDVPYVASFWYYNKGPMRCSAMIGIDEHNDRAGVGWWDYTTDARFCRTIDGDWSLVELPFRVRDAADRVRLFITGRPYHTDSIYVDDLLIRRADTDVWKVLCGTREDPQELLFNGHVVRRR